VGRWTKVHGPQKALGALLIADGFRPDDPIAFITETLKDDIKPIKPGGKIEKYDPPKVSHTEAEREHLLSRMRQLREELGG
jgi:hypothetical protein